MELRIAELDDLDPPAWLDGDELHPRVPGRRAGPSYGPDGTALTGDVLEKWVKLKQQPGMLTQTAIGLEGGHEVVVSTMYLGIDRGWSDVGPPIIWETMVFFGRGNPYMWRYATRNAAMDNHRRVVDIICRHTGAHITDERDRAPD